MLLAAPTSQRIFTVSEAARHLGVSAKTLRRWEKRTGYGGRRTKGNQRRYTKSQLRALFSHASSRTSLSSLSKELKQVEKITIAATEDIAAETLRVSSVNPNSLYSTGFLLALDTLSFLIRQIRSRINSHVKYSTKQAQLAHTSVKAEIEDFLMQSEKELVQVLASINILITISEISFRTFLVVSSILLLLTYRVFESTLQFVLVTLSTSLNLILLHYPIQTVKTTHRHVRSAGHTTLFTSTLFAEIAWELSKDGVRRLYQTINK